MRRFDDKGMMVFPSPIDEKAIKAGNVLVATALYCQKGHSLMNPRAVFNGHTGINLKISCREQTGTLVLSPIRGDRSRICLDFQLKEGDTVDMFCPVCGIALPVHSPCDACDASLICLFHTPRGDFNDCLAVCNRIGCPRENIISSGELISISRLDVS